MTATMTTGKYTFDDTFGDMTAAGSPAAAGAALPSPPGSLPGHLFEEWRRRLDGRPVGRLRGLGLAAVPLEEPQGPLVPAGRLLLLTLRAGLLAGRPVLRLTGFAGTPVAWGFAFGGPGRRVLDLDLASPPGLGPSPRVDRRLAAAAVRAGLNLAKRLGRRDRPRPPALRLPPLLAAFTPGAAAALAGDGPELHGRAHEEGLSAAELMRRHERPHRGRLLYPLAWVSHALADSCGVYADLAGPRHQVVAEDAPLRGCRGAAEFDLTPPELG